MARGVVFGDVDDDLAHEGCFEVLELFEVVGKACFSEGGVGVEFAAAGEKRCFFKFVAGDAERYVADCVNDDVFGDAVAVVVDGEVAFVEFDAAVRSVTVKIDAVGAGGVTACVEGGVARCACVVECAVDVLVDAALFAPFEIVGGDDLAVGLESCVADGEAVGCVAKFARREVFEDGVVGFGAHFVVGDAVCAVFSVERRKACDADGACACLVAKLVPCGAVAGGEDDFARCGYLFAVPVDFADAEVDFECGAKDAVEEAEVAVFAFYLVFEECLDAACALVVFGTDTLNGYGVVGGAEGF